MSKKKPPMEKQKILKHIRLSQNEDNVLNAMIEQDDTETSQFMRKLIREEAQRRGVAIPQPATATQAI